MDSAGNVLLAAHEIYARNGGAGGDVKWRPPIYKIVGLILAIASGLFIGVSFVLKKMGLLKANVKYNEEAGEGYGYLKNVWWWSGMTLMIVGEICNFVAYAFVDAILVTPLGALSVVVTTILSAIFLKERLSFVGKVGCFNCIIGSVVIVINAPSQSAVSDIQDMKKLVITPGFLSYAGVVIVGCVVVALWLGPKYGKKSMMVYLSICSLIGGLSVVATQGLGAAIVAQIGGKSQFKEWFLYVLLVFVISTLLTEIIYLNKALNLFNAALVTPTYYVFFTSSTIVTSAILFQGFKGTAATISTVIMGFLQICAGVVLLQLSKSAKDVPDAAVFKGDLDQVRTVAEQEEPEYEPRADTIRGGGAILRSLSKARTERQAKEVKKLHEENMEPIGENEAVEWDGLRRRKTVVEPGRPGTLTRTRTIHPPLGMTHFPDSDNESDNESDIHPGFFQRLRSRGKSRDGHTPVQASPIGLASLPPVSSSGSGDSRSEKDHVYGLPAGLQKEMEADTSYKPHETTIQFAPSPTGPEQERQQSRDSLHPPKPPPHTAKRQFSFQNVFHRSRAQSTGEGGESSARPTSRNSRKTSRDKNTLASATEEERLGLVKGDSQNLLSVPGREGSPPSYSDTDEEWTRSPIGGPLQTVPSGASLPDFEFQGRGQRVRRVETETGDSDEGKGKGNGKEVDKSGGGGGGSSGSGAFL
ncbi:magnesium transporter NIPA-domain-containing protein [Clohesyomyces aquaticus]|uniref:Magnesium transporter NIPA-domain-containing protein n=1 Tax=Clohesyomyces aquaticus TaxID=1231657 RepID=A0A1Y2A0H6_9PLEO|nr:magnesium transporter NIPA-domain-containing protein [Clohesyomyces aquaticus]